jgi:NhaA family Na+:H+ antiporter
MRTGIQVIRPIQEFFDKETTAGILLICCSALAMFLANSPWAPYYFDILNHHVEITIGENIFSLDKTVDFWIDDLLMAIFFFVIGLEIKREVRAGELSNIRAASLPIAAAIGGMVVPALFYMLFNYNGNMNGWAVPMATDIAFTLGLLTLMGKRIPLSLKVFVTALAIVDDLGAVLVIALFYSSSIQLTSLLTAAGIFAALMLLNYFKVYKFWIYGVLGVALWLTVYKAGIHPTIAGILLAASIPAKRRVEDYQYFEQKLQDGLSILKQNPFERDQHFLTTDKANGVDHIYTCSKYAMSPVQRLEHTLHPFVAYIVMPVFALANAGIPLDLELLGSLTGNISMGIILGLILGKQIGITLFTWLAVKLNLGELPKDLNWPMIYGMACLAGIGFTMSLFISNLAFADPNAILQAKLSILTGSIIAGIMGFAVLSWATGKKAGTNS